MENTEQFKRHKRGSTPHESIEEVYRSWLKRPIKKVTIAADQESEANTGNNPTSKAE